MESQKTSLIQAAIQERQSELQRVADILARAAYRVRRLGMVTRVLLIVLGSVVATQGSIDKLGILPSSGIAITFVVVGVLIAALAGVKTVFKFEARGAELTTLAESCHSIVRQADAAWYRQVGLQQKDASRIAGGLQLMEMQDEKLSEVQERAAANGWPFAPQAGRRSAQREALDDDWEIEAQVQRQDRRNIRDEFPRRYLMPAMTKM